MKTHDMCLANHKRVAMGVCYWWHDQFFLTLAVPVQNTISTMGLGKIPYFPRSCE